MLAPDATRKISLKPVRLTFKNIGTKFAKTVTVSDPGYTGKISESTKACKRFAKASPTSGKGPKYKVKITPLRSGKCSIVFSDTKKHKATLPITVTKPVTTPTPTPPPGLGPVVASPAAVTICPQTGTNSCATNSQGVTLTQSNYSGSFTAVNGCNSNLVFVGGINSSFTISGQSATGICTVTFVGGGGKFVQVPVTVVGSVAASPAPVVLCPSTGPNACPTHVTSLSLTQANYSGNFTESDNCAAATAVIAQLTTSTYRVTGGSQTGTCTATFTGILAQHVQVGIEIENGVVINMKKEHTK